MDIDFDYYAALGIAIIEKERGNFDDAIDMLTKIFIIEKNNSRLLIELAECHRLNDNKDQAVKLVKRSIDDGNNNPCIIEYYDDLIKM